LANELETVIAQDQKDKSKNDYEMSKIRNDEII